MEELYAEAGCKPKVVGKYLAMKVGAIAGIVLCTVSALIVPSMIIRLIMVAVAVGLILFFPRLNIEYEYIFCDGQVDFDKIMGGEKRKTVLRIDFDTVEVVAPVNSDAVRNQQNVKVRDFSSKDPDKRVYAIIGKVKEENTKILFEPTSKMLDVMWSKSPRKVQR